MSGTEPAPADSFVDVVDVTAMSAEDLLKKADAVHFSIERRVRFQLSISQGRGNCDA